jgi:hypothetical protein
MLTKSQRKAARKKFKALIAKVPDSEKKMAFILRHEMATDAEKSKAGVWFFVNGYRVEDY